MKQFLGCHEESRFRSENAINQKTCRLSAFICVYFCFIAKWLLTYHHCDSAPFQYCVYNATFGYVFHEVGKSLGKGSESWSKRRSRAYLG